MEFEKVIQLQAPASEVWGAIWDVERLASFLPGCEEVRTLEPGKRYAARVRESVGPFRAQFDLEIAVEAVEEGRSMKAWISGKDSRLGSHLNQSVELTVEPRGERATDVRMRTAVSITGKLLTLAQGLVRRKVDELTDAFAQKFKAAVEAQAQS